MDKDKLVENIIISLTDNYKKDKKEWEGVKNIFDRTWDYKISLDINGDGNIDGSIKATFELAKDTLDIQSARLSISFKGMTEDIWVRGYNYGKVQDKNANDLLQEIFNDKLKTIISKLKNSTQDEDVLTELYKKVGTKKRRNDAIDSIIDNPLEKVLTDLRLTPDDIKKEERVEKIDSLLEIKEKKKGFFENLFGK